MEVFRFHASFKGFTYGICKRFGPRVLRVIRIEQKNGFIFTLRPRNGRGKVTSKNNKKQVTNRTNINIKQPIHGRVTYSRACLTKRRLMLLAIQQNGKQLSNFINNESVGCSRLSLEPAASIGASNAKG